MQQGLTLKCVIDANRGQRVNVSLCLTEVWKVHVYEGVVPAGSDNDGSEAGLDFHVRAIVNVLCFKKNDSF